jgi:hypothetical protein
LTFLTFPYPISITLEVMVPPDLTTNLCTQQ